MSPRLSHIHPRCRGSALVIVLASVMLLMILSLAFLTSVGTELQSSKMYANGSSQKLLTQSAVNIVIGQIRVATANAALCWASQPGMLRTYDSSGQPAGYYKLYSDDMMQGTGAFDHTKPVNSVPANWYSQKGIYVDLNQPLSRSGVTYYPILDGDAADLVNFSSPLGGSVRGIGPLTGGKPAIEGYWLASNTPVASSGINQAPMPVKWLYVLQNGQVIVPDSNSTDSTVKFTQAGTKPSSSNPIVGRMAFWTDDETCKININTASEGAFWDTPRTYTTQDYYLARRQPLQGEYQRYPGHPATVCMSTVLGLNNAKSIWTPQAPFSNEDFYPITPATKPGGSRGGTVDTSLTASSAITRSVTRLYANVDELFFQGTLSGNVRQPNANLLTSPSALTTSALKKARFFLTANSQAPDVNVFNLPRVSMWPITRTTSGLLLTPYDKLISFCTTVNNHIFYFQRQDPTSPTVDLSNSARNRQLLEYLRTLTAMPFPGFGSGTFDAKYGSDRHQILVEMFDYIRSTNLQDTSTGPGSAYFYAKSLDTTFANPSYQGGQGQVVPIVDNSTSVTDSVTGANTSPRGFGRFPTVHQAALVFIGADDKTTCTADTTYSGFTYSYPAVSTASPNIQRVQAGFFLQLFDPSQGSPFAYPWYEIQVDGLNSLKWSNTATTSYSMSFTSSGVISKPYAKLLNGTGENFYGGMLDIRTLTYQRGNASAATKYPFITPPTGASNASAICPDMNGGVIHFGGGDAIVKIFALDKNGTRVSATPVQTVSLSFPAATIPVPQTYTNASMLNAAGASNSTTLRSFYDSSGKTGRLNMDNRYVFVGAQDVVRAVIATPGDMRLIAARTDVPAKFFSTLTSSTTTSTSSSDYYSSTANMSHMLRYGIVFPVYGAAGGKMVDVNYSNFMRQYNLSGTFKLNDFSYYTTTGVSYFRSKDSFAPTFTSVSNSVAVADWDTGVGNSHDGPFINKADEGDMGNSSNAPYFAIDYANSLPQSNFFSPNRMVPSPGIFGSLPTGVWSNTPWQTLLFRPGPAGHKGLGSPSTSNPSAPPYTIPPDHLFLDLFTMPVVEPYAISTPLATAGRINMNYLIVPFTYIHRDTGVRAAMKAQMVTAIPSPGSSPLGNYKTYQNPTGTPTSGIIPGTATVRYPINADATLYQFQSRFDSGDIFRAASEICSIDIVPVDITNSAPTGSAVTRANMDAYWNKFPVTGDNVRERPYANLYPLLTTKSNTYTVHYRVQLLKQTVNTPDYAVWREGTDLVTGEQRGSQTLERYIDPSDTIPDYADSSVLSSSSFPPSKPLSQYYKFRVISTRLFSP